MRRLATQVTNPTLADLPDRVPEWLLAQYWGKSRRTLQRARSTGLLGLPYLKIGHQVLYRRSDIEDFEAQRRYFATSEKASGGVLVEPSPCCIQIRGGNPESTS